MAKIDLRENEFMERFVGQDHIDSNDVQFWYQLLSCSFNFMRVQDPRVVDKTLDPYLVRLTLNNGQSLNIGSLVRVFLDRVSRIKSKDGLSTNSYYVYQSFNALYLIRCICKSYIESSSEENLIKAFRAYVDKTSQAPQPTSQPVPPPQLQLKVVQSIEKESDAVNNNQQEPTNGVVGTQEGQNENETSISTKEVESKSNVTLPTQSEPIATSEPQENAKVEITPGTNVMDQYISTIIAILVDVPLNDSTYLLQVESINALLVLLSVQMFSPAAPSFVYKSLMQKRCSIHALILTKTLLTNFVRQQPMPQETGSIIIGLASGLWRVLTLGYGSQEDEENGNIPLLARQSLLLLNILTNHYTSEKNPYREAIVSCQDSSYNLLDPQLAFDNANNDAIATATTSKAALTSNSIKINFLDLFETICEYLHNDQVALLLYLLLHSNKIFRPYILTTASSQLDKILLPMLKILYSSIEKGSHHVYMVLIIFTILSEESSFNEAVHKITIRGVPWYKDRLLTEISLGSLATLIITRSFQYNTFRIKDKFLHTNLFATLANLSNHFQYLHPYVCQRIVDLLERLTKRYLLVTKPTINDKVVMDRIQTCEVLNTDNPLARALATDHLKQDMRDASSIELDSTSAQSSTTNNFGPQRNGNAININIPDQQFAIANQQQNNNHALPPVDSQGHEYVTNSGCENSGKHSPTSNNSTSDHISISLDDTKQDINLIEEVIRMILEVINNSLAEQLRNNPDLIYTLLYKRNVFSNLLSSHPSFYNLVINVERILTFFYNKIEAYERPLSVVEIKELIQSTSKDWNYDNNRDPNSRLLFHYVEDEQPEDFFIPYIWTRIYYSSGIVWNSKRIVLFNPDDI